MTPSSWSLVSSSRKSPRCSDIASGLVIIYIGGILMIVVHAIVILSERGSYGNASMVTIVPHSATVPTLSGPPKQAVDPQLQHHLSRSWHSTDCAFALIRGS